MKIPTWGLIAIAIVVPAGIAISTAIYLKQRKKKELLTSQNKKNQNAEN